MKANIKVQGEKCELCGYEFVPRIHKEDPVCPVCRRPTRKRIEFIK